MLELQQHRLRLMGDLTFSSWKGEFIWVILCLSFEAGCRNPALGIFWANEPPAWKQHNTYWCLNHLDGEVGSAFKVKMKDNVVKIAEIDFVPDLVWKYIYI